MAIPANLIRARRVLFSEGESCNYSSGLVKRYANETGRALVVLAVAVDLVLR